MKFTRNLCHTSVLAALLCLSSPSFAHGHMGDKPGCGHERSWFKGKDHGPAGHLKHMLKRLDLSDQQREQLNTLFDAQAPKFRDLMTSMREQRQSLHELAMQDNFSPEQVASAADAQAQLMKQMILTGAELRAAAFELLTPEQREQVKQRMQDRKSRF